MAGCSDGARRAGRAIAVVAVVVAVTSAIVALRARSRRSRTPHRTGAGPNGMEYLAFGDGPRTMLFIPGGPGSDIPHGIWARMANSRYEKYARAGYTVWRVTRPRHMPEGHTLADMADDYAAFLAETIPDGVDVVVGLSLGGLIAQHLAARHPSLVRRVVLLSSACAIRPGSADLDVRWATARAEGRYGDAGEAFLEMFMPGPERAPLRRFLGPLAGRMSASPEVPAEDILVEAAAEVEADARDVLPLVRAPVLIVSGDQDEFFSEDVIEQTAALLPDCTVVLYEGASHASAAFDARTPDVVIDWLVEHSISAA